MLWATAVPEVYKRIWKMRLKQYKFSAGFLMMNECSHAKTKVLSEKYEKMSENFQKMS